MPSVDTSLNNNKFHDMLFGRDTYLNATEEE